MNSKGTNSLQQALAVREGVLRVCRLLDELSPEWAKRSRNNAENIMRAHEGGYEEKVLGRLTHLAVREMLDKETIEGFHYFRLHSTNQGDGEPLASTDFLHLRNFDRATLLFYGITDYGDYKQEDSERVKRWHRFAIECFWHEIKRRADGEGERCA